MFSLMSRQRIPTWFPRSQQDSSGPSSLLKKLPGVIAGTTFAGHLLLALTHGGPVAVPDVPAYLYFQQRLFGAAEISEVPFFPGYGLLLAPLGSVSGDVLHTAALIFNGMCAGLVVIGAAFFARQLGGSDRVSLYAAIIAAVHPAISNASRIAWPETVLAVLVLGVAIALCSGRPSWRLLGGALAGLAAMFHPRMIVVGVAIAAIGLLYNGYRRSLISFLTVFGFSMAVVVTAGVWPSARINAGLTWPERPGPIVTIGGQFVSLVASTGGLAAVGLLVGFLVLLKSVRDRDVNPAAVFLSVSSVGMLLLGGWVIAGSDRSDTLLYGRYIDPWIVPLTIVGMVFLAQTQPGKKKTACLTVLTVLAGLVSFSAADGVELLGRRIMTSSLGVFWDLSDGRVRPAVVCAVGVAVVGLLCAGSRSNLRLTAPLALCCLLAAASTFSNHKYLDDVGQVAEGQSRAVSSLPAGSLCLSHDAGSTKNYAIWLYRLQTPELEHRRINLSTGEEPCGDYVIAGHDAMATCSGARMIAWEIRADWGLWRYPTSGCD